jgi:hypothetical protein
MKKILVSLTLLGTLGLSLSASELPDEFRFFLKDKSYFCGNSTVSEEVIKKIEKAGGNCNLNDIETRNDIRSNAASLEKVATQVYGSLSNELLSNKGLGIKTVKSWQNISTTYDMFVCSLNKEEQKDLYMFFISIINIQNKDDYKLFSYLTIDNNIRKNHNISVAVYGREIVVPVKELGNNKEETDTFFKLIITEKFSEAKAFMKKVNQKKGVSQIFKQMDSACNDNNIQKVGDMFNK